MYKFLISFFVTIFVIALIIGHCHSGDYDDEDYQEDAMELVEDNSEFNTDSQKANERIEFTRPEPDDNGKIPDDFEYYHGLEIPKLVKNIAEQIITRIGYTVSYNINTKNPNWVAWNLIKEHTTGSSPRYKGYIDDTEIKGYTPSESDWSNLPQSLSHGHMCPAGDNKWDEKAMEQTFLLSNMCPQTRSLNSGSWNKLEEKCREWAKKYESIYIVCGPLYYSDEPKTMGKARIWIPDAFYKVILCVTGEPKAIGFVYPNDEEPHNMQQNVKSVDEIEDLTGIDFFCSLPDDIENLIESKSDFSKW